MHRMYKIRPSEILSIDDPYEAFCFDECCSEIMALMKELKRMPTFTTQYKSFTDLYKKYQ